MRALRVSVSVDSRISCLTFYPRVAANFCLPRQWVLACANGADIVHLKTAPAWTHALVRWPCLQQARPSADCCRTVATIYGALIKSTQYCAVRLASGRGVWWWGEMGCGGAATSLWWAEANDDGMVGAP